MGWIFKLATVVILIITAIGAGIYWYLTASLAQLEGERFVAGINQDVVILRDAKGHPFIKANNKSDQMYSLGYLHAQERFIQMDMLRRTAAGELSALFGVQTITKDQQNRIMQFRKRALANLSLMPKDQKQLLTSYTLGVNEGLASLKAMPLEYRLLNSQPQPWLEEDSLLVIFAMYLNLQPGLVEIENSMNLMKQHLDSQWYSFLMPTPSTWQPNNREQPTTEFPATPWPINSSNTDLAPPLFDDYAPIHNAWLLPSIKSKSGLPLLAVSQFNQLQPQQLYFKASWQIGNQQINGITLPGLPLMLMGSNGNLSWGLGNSDLDHADLLLLNVNADRSEFSLNGAWQKIKIEQEVIEIKDQANQTIEVRSTQFGPIVNQNKDGKLVVLQWVAFIPGAANLNWLILEKSNSIEEIKAEFDLIGLPTQEAFFADTTGNVNAKIIGPVANRSTSQGKFSQVVDVNLGWGFAGAPQSFEITNRLNNKIIIKANQSTPFHNQQQFKRNTLGTRAFHTEKQLNNQPLHDELSLFQIQLSRETVLLSQWQQQLLTTLSPWVVEDHVELNDLRKLVENWDGTSTNDPGYVIVKTYRQHFIKRTIDLVYEQLAQIPRSEFNKNYVNEFIEYPLWQLAEHQPKHLVPPGNENWSEFNTQLVLSLFDALTDNNLTLAQQSWQEKTLELNLPITALFPSKFTKGDLNYYVAFADKDSINHATKHSSNIAKFVVSPSNEAEGLLQVAGSQSFHPLSPYYFSSQKDWLQQVPTTLVPEKEKWRLILKPSKAINPQEH